MYNAWIVIRLEVYASISISIKAYIFIHFSRKFKICFLMDVIEHFETRRFFWLESILHWNAVAVSGAPAVHFEILDNIQRKICNVSDPDKASWFQSLFTRRDVASICHFYNYFHGNNSEEHLYPGAPTTWI